MNKTDYLDSLSESIAQFLAAARMGLEPNVEACPGWTVGRLVAHMGEVHPSRQDGTLASHGECGTDP